ncbi:hydrogenase maturation protease [Thiothrix fructosivorans]|uniref:Hydrogenase maturation protease n=1 Tax=Thiothrix fructosivorans TaxID=111770 RepID=A0A8B0SL27_9GAMM|nr:hydrogenase maturation protease [Thiothrix fructosivorans]QTX11765.1 hydrogenase maturation protease [Thiothrix fructosivorans]
MRIVSALPPILLFGYGNPGCGDDALGSLLLEAIAAQDLLGVECQTDMQLHVEHITDLVGREYVLFMDADMSCAAPYVVEQLTAQQDSSYTSHAISPAAVLHAFRQVYGVDAPPAYLLHIRGYAFELGDALTAQAAENLKAALAWVQHFVREKAEKI